MSAATENSTALTRQVAIGRLKEFLVSLTDGLRKQGVGPIELTRKLSAGLKVSCLECGLTLAPNELADLIDGADEKSPKLQRLGLGYCGRNACHSSFYAVTLLAPDDPQWRQVWGVNDLEISAGIVTEEAATPARPSLWEILVQQYGRKKVGIAIALIVVAGFLVYWRFRTPAWASKPSIQYKPDVSKSAGDSPFRPGAR